MIESRTEELINAGLDGELSAAEKSELKQLLGDSAEARHYREELVRLDELLKSLPEQPMDDALHGRITAGVRLPATVMTTPGGRLPGLPAWLGYGLAAAAGVVLTIAVYENRSMVTTPQDIEDMVGSMAPAAERQQPIDAFEFDEQGVRSSVTLERREGALVLRVNVSSDDAVDLSVDLGEAGLYVNALSPQFSALDLLQVEGQVIRARSSGRQKFAVLLHRSGATGAADQAVVSLVYSRDGALVKEGSLRAR